MSAARGGRKSRRSVSSKIDMFPLQSAREKQKGRWRTISLAGFPGRQILAASVSSRLFRCFAHRHDRHKSAPLHALAIHNPAADRGEQGVILAHGDVGAGMHLGAALTDKDVAGKHDFTAVALDAETLTVGVASVARRTACFFVCHVPSLTEERAC